MHGNLLWNRKRNIFISGIGKAGLKRLIEEEGLMIWMEFDLDGFVDLMETK